MFKFLNKDLYITKDYSKKEEKLKKIFDIIILGIRFDKNDNDFFNILLNNKSFDYFNTQNFFGNLYDELIKKIFEKLNSPEDLLSLGNYNLQLDVMDEILKYLLLTIERIWISHPIKYPEKVENIISLSLLFSSNKIPEINKKVYESLESKIPKDMLIRIYSQILMLNYWMISKEFRNHIIDYINNNSGNNALSVWYRLSTINPEDDNARYIFLKKNLKDELAVNAKDFVGCFNNKNEKIILFKNLHDNKCFLRINNGELITTKYYQDSIKSKDDIINLKFKDAMYIIININYFPKLFMSFTSIELNSEEAEIFLYIFIIEFKERILKIKDYFDKLERIYDFLEQFYPGERKEDLIKIKNIIDNIENSKLDDCEIIKDKTIDYTKKLSEEAEQCERLKDSLFFMEIYNYCKEKKGNYQNAIELFSNLEILGKDNDFNSLNK